MIDYVVQFEFLYQPFSWFIERPHLALIPAFVCIQVGYWAVAGCQRHCLLKATVPFVAATCWFGYTAWELYMQRAYPPETVPIRVDLLFIAPFLWGVSLVAALSTVWILAGDHRTTCEGERSQAPVVPP